MDGGEEIQISADFPFEHKYMYASLYTIPKDFIRPIPMYPTYYIDLSYNNDNFSLNQEINIRETKEINSFSEIFETKNIPKNIRKLVDEETLGISLGERRGIDILFGNIPKTGVVIDSKKEALRIKKNKSQKQTINSNPSPAVDINSGKPLLIK